jgi:hypothetical protein
VPYCRQPSIWQESARNRLDRVRPD